MTRDHNRIVWLFGKPYGWCTGDGGRLTLVPATATAPRNRDASLYDAMLAEFAGPMPWPADKVQLP